MTKSIFSLLQCILILTLSACGAEEQRLALVIGNSEYRTPRFKLENPKNDASDMRKNLKKLNFNVMPDSDDLSKNEMQSQLQTFSEQITKNSVALFYYAGHAIQHRGENYLITIEGDALNLKQVFQAMESAEPSISIIILDACRDDPFVVYDPILIEEYGNFPNKGKSQVVIKKLSNQSFQIQFFEYNGKVSHYSNLSSNLLKKIQKVFQNPALLEDKVYALNFVTKIVFNLSHTPLVNRSLMASFAGFEGSIAREPSGMALIEGPKGSITAYSTASGSVAYDDSDEYILQLISKNESFPKKDNNKVVIKKISDERYLVRIFETSGHITHYKKFSDELFKMIKEKVDAPHSLSDQLFIEELISNLKHQRYDSRNAPYTRHLLKHMMEPNLHIAEVFLRTRQAVLDETNGKQIPWEHSSLTKNFRFKILKTTPQIRFQ